MASLLRLVIVQALKSVSYARAYSHFFITWKARKVVCVGTEDHLERPANASTTLYGKEHAGKVY
jgi:hypothetical protein